MGKSPEAQAQSLAQGFLHEGGDPCHFGGGQRRPSEGDRPHLLSSRFASSLKPNVA